MIPKSILKRKSKEEGFTFPDKNSVELVQKQSIKSIKKKIEH